MAALQAGGFTLFPLAKVEKRLTEGPADNLVSYYAVWTDLLGAGPGAVAEPPRE